MWSIHMSAHFGVRVVVQILLVRSRQCTVSIQFQEIIENALILRLVQRQVEVALTLKKVHGPHTTQIDHPMGGGEDKRVYGGSRYQSNLVRVKIHFRRYELANLFRELSQVCTLSTSVFWIGVRIGFRGKLHHIAVQPLQNHIFVYNNKAIKYVCLDLSLSPGC